MGSTNLQLLTKTASAALYVNNNTNPDYYFLSTATPLPGNTITLTDAWNQDGALLFVNGEISDQTAFITAIQAVLSKFKGSNRFLAWVADPTDIKSSFSLNQNIIPMVAGSGDNRNVIQDPNGGYLAILNLRLGFTQSAILYLDTSGETPKINAIYGAAGFAFKLGWSNPQLNSTNIDVTENGITIPFGGDNNGQCLFNIQPKEGVFYQLFANETRSSNAPASAEMRYTFGSADQLITLRYPIFTGVNPEIPTNKTMLDLLVAVDPLKITDSDRTYFDFNFDSINKDLFTIPDTQFFNNTYGSAIQMAPSQGAGFGLGLRPAQNDANTTYLYLLPKGPFELKNGANGNGLVQLLCGTNSTEFLLLAEGDYLQFSTNENASSAPNFTPVSNAPVNNVNQLTTATTTSYLGVQAGAKQSSAFANISFQESYCVQSEGMIFFNEVSGAYYSSVIGCRLAGLTSKEDQAPFPMVPYQGIYSSDPSQTYQNPNKQIQGTFFEQLEAEVLRPNRRAIIQPDLCLGPIFFDLLSPTLTPITGYVLTAQGLLVKLNDGNNDAQPKGSWQELILAKSPINPDQYLKIGVCDDCGDCTDTSYEVVNPYLSNALMSAAPLIVMTQDKFGEHNGQSAFANEIQLDEFTFEINLDRNDKLKEGEDQTILIFKQSTENSVKELCETTSLWGYAEYFISTEQSDIQAVSQAILDSITEAESKTGKERIWFEDFIEKMTNPSWTGVIALNCSLDYSALPIDIQMLLGGIHGQLMAHHFGLTDNNIENNFSGVEIPIQNSSLFGLVYYNHPTPTTYTDSDNHFETLILNALFKNSVLTNFQARIAMTIPKVFEEWATLTQYTFVNNEWKALPAAVAGQNIIEIDGVYQAPEDPNGIGTVVFDSKDHFVFDFGTDTLRVLDKVVVTDAALVPITESTNDKGVTQVTAYFEMIGGIGFTDSIGIDPNNDHGDVDAFSFEATIDFSKKGLGLRGYNFQILTEIKGNRAVLGPDIPTLYDEIQTFIQKTGDSNQARSGSLYDTFPLEYVDLIYNLSTGITASSVEGTYMTGLGTPDINTTSSSDYPPVLEAVPPNFALQFKTNFGSLGALVSEDSILNAQFFLGWTASGSESQTNGKPNEVAMIFQPPDGVSLDGSFKIEGVFNSSYNQVVLDRYPLSGLAGAPIVFVVSLMDANLNLLSLPLLPDSGYAITLFGIPLVNTSSNLTWFTGNPLHVELDVYPPPSPPKVDFIFQPYIGLMSALEINTAVTGTLNINVIGPTITKLVNLPNSTLQFIQQLTDGDEDIVLYNPNSKILLWFVLNFESLTLQGIFNDPSFYGGYLKVGKPAKKKDDKGDNGNEKALAQADNNDNGDDDKKGIMSILTGLEIVFVYRKISDTLGVYAAQLVLPDKFREFEIGGFGFELPSVGVEVWTNGDFKVEVGWPFGSTNSFAPAGTQFKVTVPIEPPPLQLGLFAGFYFAKLRSEDAPDVFAGSDFSLIYMFGIGVGLEVGVEKNWSVIKFNASLSIWGTFEGMLASQKGVITDNGIDYYWFAGQLGLTLNVTGKVNFGIIKSSLEFEASIIAGLALERYHLVTFSATFMIKIEFQVKMVFFTIKFRFSFELTLFTFTLGAQGDKPAELSGPTAPFTAADANSTNSPVQKKTAQFEEAQIINLEEITPTKLEVYFTLQSTAVQTDTNAAFASYAVASFVISIDEFTNMVKALMPYMASVYGGSTLTDQLNNILANISTIENDALTTMETLFTVEVDAGSSADSSSGDSMEVGIFALPPGLQMTYAGNTINFDETQSSPDYLQTVQDYFNQLQDDTVENPSLATASTVPVTQVLFENYFGLVVQGAAATMLSSIQNGTTYANLTDALDDLDYDSLSGSVSRYLQAGLQLPVPSDTSTLAPMYALTNQQVAVAFDKDGNPILEFDLSAQSTLPSWLSLKTNSDGNLVENLDASQVFNDPQVTDSWMGNAANIDPIKPFVRIFQLTTSQQWTDSTGTNWNMRPFTDDLSSLIQNAGQGELAKMYIAELAQNANAQQQDVDNLTKVNTTPGLLIKFKIQQLPKKQISGSNNTYMENVYQVIGTDENTRDLIQEVLDNNDLSSIANVHFLTSSSDSDYQTNSSYNDGLMVRTNLSTDAEAPDGGTFADLMAQDGLSAVSDLGPLQASFQQAQAFDLLRLIWECSIVHTKGYYLQMENIDSSLFDKSDVIGVSVLVQFNNSNSDQSISLPYPNYYNVLLADGSYGNSSSSGDTTNDTTVLGAYLQNSQGENIKVYRTNIRSGCGGFHLENTTMATPSIQSNPADYLDYIYQFVQYKVNSISGVNNFQASNWSVPNGATSISQQDENNQDTGELLWTFRQTVPIYMLASLDNPYLAVGKTAQLTVRLLDMFGNALPNQWNTTVEVQYNDGLIPPGQWPGVGINYLVQTANNQPQLTVNLGYQAGDIKSQNESQDGTPSQLQQAIAKFTHIQQQLQDPNVSVTVASILSGNTFTQDINQTKLADKLASFVEAILHYLQTDNATAPTGTQLCFNLNKTYISTLSDDIIKLDVDLTIGRDPSKVNTQISDLYSEVLSVTIPVSPYMADTSEDNGDQSGIVPFAQSFEDAYQDFAGANTYVKIAQGPKRQTASGATVRAIFAVRWGENAGIHVSFPNTASSPSASQQPAYFAPTPLSTLLLTDTFANLYEYDQNGKNPTKVSRTFSKVDLDKWARLFLNQVQLILSPPLATSIAKIDADKYSAFIGAKESLAEFVTDEVASILEIPNLNPDSSAATRAFEQAMLSSLTKDYTTSTIIQVPATVQAKGNVSNPPPQLFGKVAENNTQGGQVYTLSSARLDAANESEQLAFLVSTKRPERDAFLNLENLKFNIGFIQYQFEEDEAKYGFVPSSWLTFVLPDGAPLQQNIGPVEAPIPLRSFPPNPVLISQQQIQPTQAPTTIQASLSWTYGLELGVPEAEQDQLYFTVLFNEPVEAKDKSAAYKLAVESGRPAPKNLFEALARFVFEYPQLAPHLPNIVDVANDDSNSDPTNANAIIDSLLELVLGATATWKDWQNPGLQQNNQPADAPDKISWSYSMINQLYNSTPAIELNRTSTDAPWPVITDFTGAQVDANALTRTYTPNSSTTDIKTINLQYDQLYIMTHQSVNVKAYIRRNDDLVPSNAPNGTTVNDAFIYTTATVKFGSVLVPLNQNNAPIQVTDKGSLAQTLEGLFDNFIVNPNNLDEKLMALRFSLYADSSFTLATNEDLPANNQVKAGAPILYSGETVATPTNQSGTPTLEMNDYLDNYLAPAITDWENKIASGTAAPNMSLAMTIYSNMSEQQLPLVIYTELDLPLDSED